MLLMISFQLFCYPNWNRLSHFHYYLRLETVLKCGCIWIYQEVADEPWNKDKILNAI